jgi:AcrR family transcriptional regulator
MQPLPVVIADGFAAASTNEMASRARASKTTFYSRFPTKEDLFRAVIARRMTRVFLQVTGFPEQPTLDGTLRRFGTNILTIALSPEQILLIRMVSMESGRYPELARQYYESGPKRSEACRGGARNLPCTSDRYRPSSQRRPLDDGPPIHEPHYGQPSPLVCSRFRIETPLRSRAPAACRWCR